MKTACNSDKAMSSNQHHSDNAPNPRKPNHGTQELLHRQMQQAVLLYGSGESHPSLQKIADDLALNPIKVRKLLIAAGVYRSEIATRVYERFSAYQQKASLIRTLSPSLHGICSFPHPRWLLTYLTANACTSLPKPLQTP